MDVISEGLEPPSSSLSYLPQLDSVRALAVMLVLGHHWFKPPHAPGSIGVWIFFVLSGFLITRILLKSRRESVAENRRAMVTFYIRRFLRIFPLYYFVLFVGIFFSATLRSDWAWYFTYLQNFRMITAAKSDYIFGTHLWSLAVEEQFYIVWPLLMLFVPRKWLLPIISIAIASAVAIRVYLAHAGWRSFDVYIFTPSSLDTLGLGALLAYFVTYRSEQVRSLRTMSLLLGLVTFVIAALLRWRIGSNALVPVPMGLLSLWMISWAADGIPGVLGRLISISPIIYIGRISYGIYVYHYFVPIILRPMFDRMRIGEGNVFFAAICFVVTIIIASLSWFLMERPINSLKDRFAANTTPVLVSPTQCAP